MEKFNHIKELETFYKKFKGNSLDVLLKYVNETYPNIKLTTNKGIVGQVLEGLIGNPPNSDPNPDVKNIKVELKVLPLRKNSHTIQPKERSKIKSLNYNEIIKETWPTSGVKSKMDTILFLMYEQPIGKTYKDWKEFIYYGPLLYELKNQEPKVVEKDWKSIKQKVTKGNANKLSEGDSKILGACTSGSGKEVEYGRNKKAKQRSYSLKHSYLKHFYNANKKNIKFASLNIPNKQEPQDYVLDKVNSELLGKNLNVVCEKFKIEFSTSAKSSFSLLINRVLNIDDKKRIKELEENGIVIKTIPMNPKTGIPWESMSFPKFSLVDLINEEWDGDRDEGEFWEGENESTFKNIITQKFIFIPIYKEKVIITDKKGNKSYKFRNWDTWIIGESVFWEANSYEINKIREEWEEARATIRKGIEVEMVKYGGGFRQENNLLKQKNTEIIHIRPHARNSKDIDIPFYEFTNKKVNICWQSFWLNKSFVKVILDK